MSEIIVRAWDTHRKKMWSAEELGKDELTLSPDGRGFVNVSGISSRLSECLAHLIPLQFTGLHDKGGKEIYEGDIVTYNGFVVKGIVKYGRYQRQAFMNGDQPHENIGFYIKGIPEKSKSGLSNTHEYSLIQHNNVIIVGNKFEKKEQIE